MMDNLIFQEEQLKEICDNLRKKNVLPNSTQQLLIEACTISSDEAIKAYNKWKSLIDIDFLDHESYRLLPMLYHNMDKHKVNDPILQRCKGVYKKTWYKNQIALKEMKELIITFHQLGIKTMILKGMAMCLQYYSSPGLRPMNDFDIVVPYDQAIKAIDFLQSEGWESMDLLKRNKIELWLFPRVPINERYLNARHAMGFRNPAGVEIDVHWHISPRYRNSIATRDFWNHSESFNHNNFEFLSLNSTDLLVHTIIHGLQSSSNQVMRWIIDAQRIIIQSAINWNRLFDLILESNNELLLKTGLFYLSKLDDSLIPNEILQNVINIRDQKDITQRIDLIYTQSIWKRYWMIIKEQNPNTSGLYRLTQMFSYICRIHRLKNNWQFPLFFVYRRGRKIIKKLTCKDN